MIVFNIFYQGVDTVPTEYTGPLLAFSPAVAAANATDYPGLTIIDSTTMESPVCQQHGAANMMFPISIRSYNIQAQRAAFDAFNTFTADATFINSAVLFEGYSTQAVKRVRSNSTAFPHRADNFVMYVVFTLFVLIAFANSPQEHRSSATPSMPHLMTKLLRLAIVFVKACTRQTVLLNFTRM